MTTPPRRWFSFTLRTLFVVVTVTAVVAWYAQSPRIEIVGEFVPGEMTAILKIWMKSQHAEDFAIRRIEKVSSNRVEVIGEADDEFEGSVGKVMVMEKYDGKWTVIFDCLMT